MPETELPRVTPEPGTLRLVEKPKDHGLAGLADDGWYIVHRHKHEAADGERYMLWAIRVAEGELTDKERKSNADHVRVVGPKAICHRKEQRVCESLEVVEIWLR